MAVPFIEVSTTVAYLKLQVKPYHSRVDPDRTAWLSADQQRTWMPFCGVLLGLPSALDRQLQRDAGLSLFAYLVMAALSDSPDHTLRMSDLAAVATGSLSRLSHTVKKLEQAGWVQRRPDPADARTTLATLTETGLAKLAAAAPGHVAEVRRLVVDVLSPEQFAQLGDAARAVAGRVLPVDGVLRRRLDGC
jgi:DNA-binding MarR family transcriptional regulator